MANRGRGGHRGAHTIQGGTRTDWVDELKLAFKALGKPYAQVAREAGTSPNLVARMRGGEVPYGEVETLMRWMEAQVKEK